MLQSDAAWCRFITGNDIGATGSHQAGFYVPKCASALLFDEPGRKGENKEKKVRIRWQGDFVTESRMKYYGQGTRNEYRITRFGRDFPFLQDGNIGDLLIIAKHTESEYSGFVLSDNDDIDGFCAYFNLPPDETNRLIDIAGNQNQEDKVLRFFNDFAASHSVFPSTAQMAAGARECYGTVFGVNEKMYEADPDGLLVSWMNIEFKLFKYVEERAYAGIISRPFDSLSVFVRTANEVLNRRKARAGKSLEHHLSDIFRHNDLMFEEQAVTEGNKRPDFVFPSGLCYHDLNFPTERLVVLGAKNSCKDRWRQVLTEADRVERKYLFTMQPGVSRNQLKEMHDSLLTLVVPHGHLDYFPIDYRKEIKDLRGFIQMVKEKQRLK